MFILSRTGVLNRFVAGWKKKVYWKHYGSADNRSHHAIPNRVDIDERPEEANNREQVGHWEGNTIIGKNHKGAIVTLDERKSKLCLAKPYHSWERGQNESANGLLRQYFPKSMELVDVTKKQVFDAVHKLNSRPRKCLGYKTPYEVFEELTAINQKTLLGYALMTWIQLMLFSKYFL